MRKITEAFKLKYDNIFAKLMNISVDELHFDKLKINESICVNENAWQKHSTPEFICKQMIDLYSFGNYDKILVLFNLELVKELINRNIKKENIYFISDYSSKSEFLSKYFKEINYINLNEYSINDLEEKIKSFNVKKFDVVFSNPPYASSTYVGLDIKILMTILKYTKNSIFIQPSAWALRTRYKLAIQKEFISKYGNKVKKLIFINPNVFDKGCIKFDPLVISYISSSDIYNNIEVIDTLNNYSYIADSIYDVNNFAKNNMWIKVVKPFIKKINDFMKNNNSCADHIILDHSKITDYSVFISLIRGNAACYFKKDGKTFNKSFCSLINQDDSNKINKTTKLKDRDKWIYSFNCEEERNNFIDYCKLKFTRFCQAIYKFDGNVDMSDIPWLDFKKHYSDNDLYKLFNLSNEEINFIESYIKE